MKFLVLGASGMAGHMICQYLKKQGHDVVGYCRHIAGYSNIIEGDVRETEKLKGILVTGQYDVVINAVGILNTAADDDIENAVYMNSYLPHWLAKTTRDLKTRVIHMSTDCVFSGHSGPYTEDSLRDGTSYYARTKALGEIEDEKNLTIRTSVIGPDVNPKGIGLLNWFMRQTDVLGYTKAMWTGVSTLELAKYIEFAAINNKCGLVHLVNDTNISKYELLILFNHYFKKDMVRINPFDGYSTDKSLLLDPDKLGYKVPSYDEMVHDLSNWVFQNIDKYPHYQF